MPVFLPNGVSLPPITTNPQPPQCFTGSRQDLEDISYNKQQALSGPAVQVNGVDHLTPGGGCAIGSYVPPGTAEPTTSTAEPTTKPDHGDSPLAGSAAPGLGLSALSGSALLSSGSSASSGGQAPAATSTPAVTAVAEDDSVDHKAIAQQQAASAPAAQAAPVQTADQQKQLANTGVEGTLVALAVGLIAAAAGAGLLVLRRRAA